jgi:KaiC
MDFIQRERDLCRDRLCVRDVFIHVPLDALRGGVQGLEIPGWNRRVKMLADRAALLILPPPVGQHALIDSLSDLQYAAPDAVCFREFVYSLMQRLSREGISPIMTSEIPDLFHVGRLAEYGISHLSDNVILLQYLRTESRLLRTVTILKSRGSAHEPEIREFDITPGGIVLGDPIVSEQVAR